MQLRCTGNRNDPRLLRQQPGKRNLSRCCLFPLSEIGKQINQCLICLSVLRREARDDVAEVSVVELGVFADFPGEKTLSQGTEWNEADPEFVQSRDYLRFGFSPPKRIFALQCGYRLHRVRAADGLNARLG